MIYLRVLVIDDSLTIRAMMEALIEREQGCRVVGTASRVADARGMIVDLIPNVITLDLNMPGMDGWSFLDELKGRPHPPVIVVSSSTRKGSTESSEAIARGAFATFDKDKLLSDASDFVGLLREAASSVASPEAAAR